MQPKVAAAVEEIGKQWLFVIGINKYQYWPPLKTAVGDATTVRDILTADYYFSRDTLVELYEEQATRKNIIAALRHLAQVVREQDSLVIYYAGHGHLDPLTKEGSWIPVESAIDEASSWISNDTIRRYLSVDTIRAKHILLVSDSCFAGDFFREHRGGIAPPAERMVKVAYGLDSRQVLTSGGVEPVSDAGFASHSVFSHFLIKALRNSASAYLVPSEIFLAVRSGVAENAEQVPQLGSLAGAGGQQGGELVLFRRLPGQNQPSFAGLDAHAPAAAAPAGAAGAPDEGAGTPMPGRPVDSQAASRPVFASTEANWKLPPVGLPAVASSAATTKLSARATAGTMKEACELATTSVARSYFAGSRPADEMYLQTVARHNCNMISRLPNGHYRVEVSIEFFGR